MTAPFTEVVAVDDVLRWSHASSSRTAREGENIRKEGLSVAREYEERCLKRVRERESAGSKVNPSSLPEGNKVKKAPRLNRYGRVSPETSLKVEIAQREGQKKRGRMKEEG